MDVYTDAWDEGAVEAAAALVEALGLYRIRHARLVL
jgi:hypothetical protein